MMRSGALVALLFIGCGGDAIGVGTSDAGGGDLSSSGGGGKWYTTCGDPVCRGHQAQPGVAACTAVMTAGAACSTMGAECDPQNDCNALLVCSATDPKLHPGGCPVSARRYKEDIQYLDGAGLRQYHDELMRLPLATWRYRTRPERRLGFLLEDASGSTTAPVDAERDMVDLYGYTSMTVAALQVQAAQIAALEQEVEALQKELARRKRR
jgi:hypothetical protein